MLWAVVGSDVLWRFSFVGAPGETLQCLFAIGGGRLWLKGTQTLSQVSSFVPGSWLRQLHLWSGLENLLDLTYDVTPVVCCPSVNFCSFLLWRDGKRFCLGRWCWSIGIGCSRPEPSSVVSMPDARRPKSQSTLDLATWHSSRCGALFQEDGEPWHHLFFTDCGLQAGPPRPRFGDLAEWIRWQSAKALRAARLNLLFNVWLLLLSSSASFSLSLYIGCGQTLRICFQHIMALVDQEMGTMIFGAPVKIPGHMKFMQPGLVTECPQVAVVMDPSLTLIGPSPQKMVKVRTLFKFAHCLHRVGVCLV